MSHIDDFIAHGLLPFVGRKKELEKITAFRQSISEAQRLRVMLLTAEAGVGKSRLLEESLQALSGERTAVVHAKLYPEAANSPASLLSRSLWKSPPGRTILRSQPGENLSEVIAGLQRLSRLRPTLLVLEDIHLFSPESIPDLARLFDALADETVSVLCLSRPVTIAALGVLETYLVESIRMEGIGPEAVADLWRELFGRLPADDVVGPLHAATKGNVLAIRSGLRWAVQSGTIVPGTGSGGWRTAGHAAAFEGGLRRSVALVAEGMVAHLRREDREGAQLLATLGEVFAREAARALLPDSDRLLAELTARGIIVETFHPVSPLASVPLTEPGKGWQVAYPSSSTPLLAFTHSLLHAHLAEHAAIHTLPMLTLLSRNAPLYSLLPLRLLEKANVPEEFDSDVLIRGIRRLSAIAVTLDQTANWRDGADLLKPMFHLLGRLEEKADTTGEAKLLWRMNAQHISLSVLRRSMDSPEWIATHERQLKITEAPATLTAAQYRALAHSYVLDRIGLDKTYEEGVAIINDLDELLNRFVELRTDVTYVYILESLLHHAFANSDYEMIRNVQKRTAVLLADADLKGGARQTAIRRILPPLLKFYSTPDELREREESIPLIETYHSQADPFYGTGKLQFLGVSGRFAEALDLIDPVMHRTSERGLWSNFFNAWSWRIVCAVGIGRPFEDVAREADEFLQTISDKQGWTKSAEDITAAFALAGLLAGTTDEGLARLETFGLTVEDVPEVFRAMTELEKRNLQILKAVEFPVNAGKFLLNGRTLQAWQSLVKHRTAGADSSAADIAGELIAQLESPILQIYDVLPIRGTLSLWNALTQSPLPDALRRGLIRKAKEALGWLETRGIPAYMPPLLLLLEELGSAEEAKEWREKIAGEKERQAQPRPTPTSATEEIDTIRISMLGTIRAALPAEELAPIRGVRIRTLLGLMVADRIIGTPLSQEEFLALAGGKGDPEHARKKKNMGVVRLREIIGYDAILTDGPTPQLNTEIVSVDLLEVHDLVQRALSAARAETFARALPLIEEALARYGGDVPFPTLYENFFEAAREDFEGRMRQAVIEIGRGMLSLGDAAGAEPFLRKAFEALPGDDEIPELLQEALERSGNRIEAERVRMRMEAQEL